MSGFSDHSLAVISSVLDGLSASGFLASVTLWDHGRESTLQAVTADMSAVRRKIGADGIYSVYAYDPRRPVPGHDGLPSMLFRLTWVSGQLSGIGHESPFLEEGRAFLARYAGEVQR